MNNNLFEFAKLQKQLKRASSMLLSSLVLMTNSSNTSAGTGGEGIPTGIAKNRIAMFELKAQTPPTHEFQPRPSLQNKDKTNPAGKTGNTPKASAKPAPAKLKKETPVTPDPTTPATGTSNTPKASAKPAPAEQKKETPVTPDPTTPATGTSKKSTAPEKTDPAKLKKETPVTPDPTTPATGTSNTPKASAKPAPAEQKKETPVTPDPTTPAAKSESIVPTARQMTTETSSTSESKKVTKETEDEKPNPLAIGTRVKQKPKSQSTTPQKRSEERVDMAIRAFKAGTTAEFSYIREMTKLNKAEAEAQRAEEKAKKAEEAVKQAKNPTEKATARKAADAARKAADAARKAADAARKAVDAAQQATIQAKIDFEETSSLRQSQRRHLINSTSTTKVKEKPSVTFTLDMLLPYDISAYSGKKFQEQLNITQSMAEYLKAKYALYSQVAQDYYSRFTLKPISDYSHKELNEIKKIFLEAFNYCYETDKTYYDGIVKEIADAIEGTTSVPKSLTKQHFQKAASVFDNIYSEIYNQQCLLNIQI